MPAAAETAAPTRAWGPRAAAWWRDPRAAPLAVLGGLLVASGIVHLGVWGAAGGPWEGPLAWRKPILFGISGGLTSLSLGWVWSWLPWRRGDGWLATLAAWAMVAEIALIDLQCWRGVASHFNRSTPLDSLLYDAMGVLILIVTLVAADLTLRLVRGPTVLERDLLAAARAGLVLLLISCGLGIWASVHGDLQAARGLAPEVYGAAGVTKFPHGAAIHALQWLPFLAWAARRAGLPPRRRLTLVHVAAAGSGCVLLYALVQTLAGRARFDAPPALLAVVAVGTALMVVPFLLVAGAWVRRPAGAGLTGT